MYKKINSNYEKFTISSCTNPTPTSKLCNGFGSGSWIVPPGVSQAIFTVTGGSGGSTGVFNGGFGAKVTATLSNLKSGDTYIFFLGKNGNERYDNEDMLKTGGVLFSGGISINVGNGGSGSCVSLNRDDNVILVAGFSICEIKPFS